MQYKTVLLRWTILKLPCFIPPQRPEMLPGASAPATYQLAIVNAPLADEFGSNLVKFLYEQLDIPSLFLVPGEQAKQPQTF